MSVGIFNAETSETKDVADKARAAILDDELDENSNNAVKNKVIAQKITELNQSIEELNTLLNGMDETLGGKLDVSKIANNLVTTEEGYALDARQGKALSDAVNNKARMIPYNAIPYIMAINNIGDNTKKLITLSNAEQVVYLMGSGSAETYFFYQLGGQLIVTHNFGGMEINTVVNNHIIHIDLPTWFRGILISYMPFALTDE